MARAEHLMRLPDPEITHKADLGMLMMRYQGLPSTDVLLMRIIQALANWRLTSVDLMIQTRDYWQSQNHYVTNASEEVVGSSYDT